jgi:hypothetical protein
MLRRRLHRSEHQLCGEWNLRRLRRARHHVLPRYHL